MQNNSQSTQGDFQPAAQTSSHSAASTSSASDTTVPSSVQLSESSIEPRRSGRVQILVVVAGVRSWSGVIHFYDGSQALRRHGNHRFVFHASTGALNMHRVELEGFFGMGTFLVN
nr:hypothetical protein Iba_chr01cCG9750 [Ipomoea batatas]